MNMIKDNATEAVMRELNASYGIMTFDELLALTGYSQVELASAIGVLTAERKIQIRVNCLLDFPSGRHSCKELLFMRFRKLVSIHFMQHREVNYYASKLHISPKYLSTSVKTVSGRTVREWINEAVIKEIKYQLLNTALSIKEISGKLGFSDLSSLGKYFKTQTGVSPKTYRMSGEDVNLIVKNEIHFTT